MKQDWFKDIFEHFPDLPDAGNCCLDIRLVGEAAELRDAWALLPPTGQGWVCLDDSVQAFQPGMKPGFLLNAEVTNGNSTLVLRMVGGGWKAWEWNESPGDDCRAITRSYKSSAPVERARGKNLAYRTYWKKQDDDGVPVWVPVGSRLIGWRD